MNKNDYTPMMQQYLKIKEDYTDAIVFFRLGDFYEMFFDDAILASKVLEIALTSRDAGEKVPMCGVPYHAVKPYVQKLIEKGFKIAIAEQVTEPGKGLVQREVIRLITPGTVFEEGVLDSGKNNYIGAVLLTEHGYALTYIDVSTGEAFITDQLDKREVMDMIQSLDMLEIVLTRHFDESFVHDLQAEGVLISYADQLDIIDQAQMRDLNREQKRAASFLLHYLVDTQKQDMHHLMPFTVIQKVSHMQVDYRVLSHLEIHESLVHQQQTTLMHWLNETHTAMGARYLKAIFHQPLKDINQLNDRYDVIEALMPYGPRQEVITHLKSMYDINRIIGRVAFQTVNARDLDQLKETLKHVPHLEEALMQYDSPIIKHITESIDTHEALRDYLERAIHETPPLSMKEGGIIKYGFNDALDELRDVSKNGKAWLVQFESEERERTGIKNLKVGYNRVFGYYIEVSKGNTALVKDAYGYERKQTLANSERYISPILKEKEEILLHAEEKSQAMEYDIFKDIRDYAETFTHSLQVLANSIAKIDAFLSLAVVAEKYHYVRPNLTADRKVKVMGGRHPVVEHFTTFIKNNVIMDDGEIFLITGPNMSGKSTYMRMFSMIVFMAQCGSYVPADEATLPIYDALFTRIGSSDDLSGGKSTFMVEMVESNEALSRATSSSLILFDEIGRGTATYDGMALAQSMIEYIHEKIGAQTLFSTHYHELTVLDQSLNRLTNLCVKAKEEKDAMVFLHHVEKGTTDKSYGIQVASLAHLPASLIARAKVILSRFEEKEIKVMLDLFNYDEFEENITQALTLDEQDVLAEVEKVNTDHLSPIEALLLLKHLQDKLKKKAS